MYRDSQTWVSRNHSEWSKDSEHSQDLDDTELDISHDNWNNGQAHDAEIHYVPGILKIRLFSVNNESIDDDFEDTLDSEDTTDDEVNSLESDGSCTLWVHHGMFKCQQDGREYNQEQDEVIKMFVTDNYGGLNSDPIRGIHAEKGVAM